MGGLKTTQFRSGGRGDADAKIGNVMESAAAAPAAAAALLHAAHTHRVIMHGIQGVGKKRVGG